MEEKRRSKNEIQSLMTKLNDLKIPSRLLRSKMKQKKFKPDVLSNSTIKFNSVSVDFVFDFYDAFILGKKYPNVKIYEVVEDVQNIRKGETGNIDAEGRFCRPYGEKPVRIDEGLLREKPRDRWSTNDLVNFGMLPEMRLAENSQIVVDNINDEPMVGQAFQGAFISQARGCCFSDLIDALKLYYSKVNDVGRRYVWMDIFCANQPQLCDQKFDEAENKRINDLLAFGLHDAIANFDEVLLFFDSFKAPTPTQRAWCIWELYAMAVNDLPFDIISTSEILNDTEKDFLDGELNILALLGSLNLDKLQCSNDDDRLMIMNQVLGLSGGFSALKQTITDKVRKWVLNFANNLWLMRLDVLQQKVRNNVSKIEEVCEVEDGRNLYYIGDLLSDFGESDLAINFVQAAAQIFEGLQEELEKTLCDNLLGNCFKDKGNFKAALKYYEAGLGYDLVQPDKDERNIAVAYSNLGNVYGGLKEFVKAEECIDKAVELHTKVNGKDSVEVIETLTNKQALLIDQKKFDEAVKLGEELLTLQNLNGHNKAIVLNNLGKSYSRLGEFEKAVKFLEESLRIFIEIYGSGHQFVGVNYMNLGEYYRDLGRLEEAEVIFFKAKETHEKNKDVRWTADAEFNLGLLYLKQKRKPEALKCFKDARKGHLLIHGPESEEVKEDERNIKEAELL